MKNTIKIQLYIRMYSEPDVMSNSFIVAGNVG
jgi:hypothetical protein